MDIGDNKENYGLGIGLCFGALAGFVLGLFINNIMMGLSICSVIGVVIGNIYDEVQLYKRRKEKVEN